MDGHKAIAGNNKSNAKVIVSFRATVDEIEAIEAAAAGDAQSRATWVRRAVIEAIRATQGISSDVTSIESRSWIRNELRDPVFLRLFAAFAGSTIGGFIGATVAVFMAFNLI